MGSERRAVDRSPSTMIRVGLWGAGTAVLALLVSGGSIPVFVLVMLAIGILQRLAAYAVLRRRGIQPPRWWWT